MTLTDFTKDIIGLYTDNGNQPDQLIVASEKAKVIMGENRVPVTLTYLTAGEYWIMQVFNAGAEIFERSGNATAHFVSHLFNTELPGQLSGTTAFDGDLYRLWIEVCEDTDEDGIDDVNDNCIVDYNPDQNDVDGDGIGNLCDSLNVVSTLSDIQGHLYLDDFYSGVILRSSNGSCWMVTVNDTGQLETLPVECP